MNEAVMPARDRAPADDNVVVCADCSHSLHQHRDGKCARLVSADDPTPYLLVACDCDGWKEEP